MSLYAGGLGGTVDLIATNRPFYGLDSVAWYVHAPTGLDAAAPAGRDKQRPLATLGRAVLNASPNDVIVLLDGHTEVIVTAVDIAKRGLVIVGCGQTAGVPNVTLANGHAFNGMLSVSAQNVQFRNIRFLPNVIANSNQPNIVVGPFGFDGEGFVMDGCYVECGDTNGIAYVTINVGDRSTIKNTTFISVATAVTTRPLPAVTLTGAVSGLRLSGAVFSDGVFGFSNGYALDLNGGTALDLMGDAVSLLLGASMRLGAGATGYLIPVITGGGAIEV